MKTISRFLAIATLAAGLNAVNVPQANAGFFISFGAPVIGTILGFAGWSTAFLGRGTKYHEKTWNIGVKMFFLDGQSQEVEFVKVSKEAADVAGLSEEEFNSYNDEVERLNLVASEANSSLVNASKADYANVQVEVVANMQSEVSPATFSAAQKILKANFK